jgi:putative membrane-bound dehydrogenase-like protein
MKTYLLSLIVATQLLAAEQEIINSQPDGQHPPTPAEAAAAITLPPGFNVTLFAAEPDIHQPIAMTFDDRGRLWVAESYTYEKQGQWDLRMKDRILIFEDHDQDGRFDKRTVFLDGLERLTGLEVGYGGVWVTTSPTFCFIPDKDRDDKPDGPPEVLLDGFGLNAGHNMVNGLLWGPDGWMYIRHGITDVSKIGPPGTPEEERLRLTCGIWRYHPARKVYELVVSGTTNPWGFDWNEEGEMFLSNNVNGHLWHAVPGSFFKRMHGQHFNPHLYEYMDMCADHNHWDDRETWSKSRSGENHSKLGGGHSHCGLMIYQGDNWPEQYRGKAFLCNTHGRRINMDRLERSGSGYVAKHEDDFLMANQPWFRGVEMKYGPDGGVYVLDWTDNGECHDHDGVHRTSGRIYKITYGDPHPVVPDLDLQQLSNMRLINLLGHQNQWYVRKAVRILQERANLDDGQAGRLKELFLKSSETTVRLSALWVLSNTLPEWMESQLGDKDEAVVCWLIRLILDHSESESEVSFARLAESTPSDLVRSHLAGTLPKMATGEAWAMAEALATHSLSASDKNFQLLLWYGLERLVAQDPVRGMALLKKNPSPLLKQFIARRIGGMIQDQPEAVAALLKDVPETDLVPVIVGLSEALKGWGKVDPPEGWKAFSQSLSGHADAGVQSRLAALNQMFGAGLPVDELKKIAVDKKQTLVTRNNAIRSLARSGSEHNDLLFTLLGDREVNLEVIQGLAMHDHAETGKMLIKFYSRFNTPPRQAAIATMVSRPEWARDLLQALQQGTIPKDELSAFHARQIAAFGDEGLTTLLAKTWGSVRKSSAEKEAAMKKWTELLTEEHLGKADLLSGQAAFNKVCAACHKLFGEGGSIGPDLTGGGRKDTFYLLENIIDPSAVVPIDFRMTMLTKTDGAVFAGNVTEQNDQVVTLQTTTEKVTVPRSEIKKLEQSASSTMPEGLLNVFSEQEIVDLIGYLQR